MLPYSIAVHGGAGTISKNKLTQDKEAQYTKGLEEALSAGEVILKAGGTSIEAVASAVRCLEDHPLFNAGKGSVFTFEGTHEMDAAIMCGKTLKAGSVAGIQSIKNPISLAKKIMDTSEFVFLSGQGAENFAREHQLEFESGDYFFTEDRFLQLQSARNGSRVQLDHADDKKFGTVGAVAIDRQGNLAAATSTGGMTNKRYGRIGDSPVIGAGTYANNHTCAVSATGHGEYFIRSVVAYDISCLMEYKGFDLQKACEKVVNEKLIKLKGEGGVIAVDLNGNISLCFNSEGMYRAYVKEGGKKEVRIFR